VSKSPPAYPLSIETVDQQDCIQSAASNRQQLSAQTYLSHSLKYLYAVNHMPVHRGTDSDIHMLASISFMGGLEETAPSLRVSIFTLPLL
jgi:hypothetical protein